MVLFLVVLYDAILVVEKTICSHPPGPSDGPGSNRFPDYNIPKYFFRHNLDEDAEFWYPITIPEPTIAAESLNCLPFISCRTSRCWLATTANTPEIDYWMVLRDSAGVWAGALELHTWGPLGASVDSVELIAISIGTAQEYSCIVSNQ